MISMCILAYRSKNHLLELKLISSLVEKYSNTQAEVSRPMDLIFTIATLAIHITYPAVEQTVVFYTFPLSVSGLCIQNHSSHARLCQRNLHCENAQTCIQGKGHGFIDNSSFFHQNLLQGLICSDLFHKKQKIHCYKLYYINCQIAARNCSAFTNVLVCNKKSVKNLRIIMGIYKLYKDVVRMYV